MQYHYKPDTKSTLVLTMAIVFFTLIAMCIVPDLTATNMLILYLLSVLSSLFYALQNRTFLIINHKEILVRQNCLLRLKRYALTDIRVEMREDKIRVFGEHGNTDLILTEFSQHDRDAINQYFQQIQQVELGQQQAIPA